MYRQMARNDKARTVMQDGLQYCAYRVNNNDIDGSNNQDQDERQQQLPPCPAALLNNLGLLELDERYITPRTPTLQPTRSLTNAPFKDTP